MGRKRESLLAGQRRRDHLTLGVLARFIPVDVVDTVLRETGRWNARARQLEPRIVVYFVMALPLYARASYDAVLRELVEGLRWLRWPDEPAGLACKSALTQARTRLGVAPLRELFQRIARPLATPDTPGAWYRGRRLVSIDGTTLDLPDLPARSARGGAPVRPPSRVAGMQRVSAVARAGAAGDRHARYLRGGHRWLRHA